MNYFENTTRIAQYEILETIGRGGMGVVYKALDTTINRIVAIKMINMIKSEKIAKRFIKEAMICAQCKHPNIVSIYNINSYHNIPYIVMEYIEGIKLLEYIKDIETKKWDQYVNLMIKITAAIQYIHEKDIIHRDLKPDNIIIRSNGEPVIFDFGIAKTMGHDFCELTATGEILGTVQYMAPEQILSPKDITKSIDIYSLGAIFYHMVTNRPPVQEATNISMMYHLALFSPILPHTLNKTIPKSLENIILKAIDKNANNRYSSAEELISALKEYKKETISSHIQLRSKVNNKLNKVTKTRAKSNQDTKRHTIEITKIKPKSNQDTKRHAIEITKTKPKSNQKNENINIEEECQKMQTLSLSRVEYHKYTVHKHYVMFLKVLLFLIIIGIIFMAYKTKKDIQEKEAENSHIIKQPENN